MNQSPIRIEESLPERIDGGGKCLVPYITGGFDGFIEAIYAAAEAGADAIEIGYLSLTQSWMVQRYKSK